MPLRTETHRVGLHGLLPFGRLVLLFLILCLGCNDSELHTPESAVAESRDPYQAAMDRQENPQREQVIALQVKDVTVEVEVAGPRGGSNLGLMFRKSMGTDEGMWFEFDKEEIRSFWMRNTKLPLSIAFVDSKGVITNVADMIPHDPSQVWSKRPARYALEMNRGWFQKKGIRAGDEIRIGEKKPNPKLQKGDSPAPDGASASE